MLDAARALFAQPDAAAHFQPSEAVEKIIGEQKPVVVAAIDGPQVCAHEDTEAACPYCASTVDTDTRVCLVCKEGVAPIKRCIYCDEELGLYVD